MKEIFGGIKDDFKIQYNWLVQICYTYEKDIPDQVLPPSAYYEWLFEPLTYDYSKFNPLWILDFKVNAYFLKFRGIPQLKDRVVSFLKDSYHEDLAFIFTTELLD